MLRKQKQARWPGWEQGQAEVGRDGGCHSAFTYISLQALLTLSDTGTLSAGQSVAGPPGRL